MRRTSEPAASGPPGPVKPGTAQNETGGMADVDSGHLSCTRCGAELEFASAAITTG